MAHNIIINNVILLSYIKLISFVNFANFLQIHLHIMQKPQTFIDIRNKMYAKLTNILSDYTDGQHTRNGRYRLSTALQGPVKITIRC